MCRRKMWGLVWHIYRRGAEIIDILCNTHNYCLITKALHWHNSNLLQVFNRHIQFIYKIEDAIEGCWPSLDLNQK